MTQPDDQVRHDPARPSLSVVIPVHNAADTLGEQIEAGVASRRHEPAEIVVVDNLSTDGSRAVAERFAAMHEMVRVVAADERPGEAYARNTGLAAARAPAVAFCDADDVVSSGWGPAMRRALAEAEYVTGPVELDRLNPPWLAGFRGRRIYAELPTTVQEIPFAHGCNIGVRREVAERLGGFVDHGRAGTDVDFAIRAWTAGVRLRWDEDAMVHYRHRVGTRDRWRQSVSYGRAGAHHRALVGEPWDLRTRAARQLRRARWLVATAPRLGSRAHRARWLWTLGIVVGELRGGER
jgi:glycosyltransferase involved in cell wall biosynthesis